MNDDTNTIAVPRDVYDRLAAELERCDSDVYADHVHDAYNWAVTLVGRTETS